MNTKNKEEILARKCLELLVNRNFLKLLISDRPNLQSQELNVGIEVTTETAKTAKEKFRKVVELRIEMDKVIMNLPVRPENAKKTLCVTN